MTNPHDALFQYTFSRPEHAARLFRDRLPASIGERVDWATLERLPGSFVDQELAWRHTDLLYRVALSGREALIYVLLEHQSTIDPLMPLRLLGYMSRIWERIVKQDPKAKAIPAIVPLVIYHGSRPWTAPTRFIDIVNLEPRDKQELAATVPDFGFWLDDLSDQSDKQLRARAMTELGVVTLLSLQRLPNAPDPTAAFAQMIDLIAAVTAVPSGVEALAAILCYVFKVSDPEPSAIKELLESRVGARAEEAFMTTAERLIQQGEAKGEAKGRAEGEARGRAEGRAELLVRLLTLKFGPLSPETEKRLGSAAIADLDRWSERVLSAQHLEEIFR
jgi:predicted transposase/invertase (TIGR01784 family)